MFMPSARVALPGGVFVLLGLLFLSAAPLSADDDSRAAAALNPLRKRLAETSADREKLRQDLVAFRRTYAGTTQAVQAAQMLSQLPSPLDKLDPKHIPSIERFDWHPKELVAVLGEHRMRQGAAVSSVVCTPEAKTPTVISAGGNVIRFWNPTDMRQKDVLGFGAVTVLALSKDGHSLAAGNAYGTIKVWDISGDKPKELYTLPAGTTAIAALAFAPSGKTLASGAADNQVRLFEIPPPNPVKEKYILLAHTAAVHSLSYAPDGKLLASGSADATVRVWDTSVAGEPKERDKLEGHEGGATAVAFSPDGRTLAAGTGKGPVLLWNTAGNAKPTLRGPLSYMDRDASGKPVVNAKGHDSHVYGLAFSPNSQTLASCGADTNIRVWNVPSAKERYVLKGQQAGVVGHQLPVTSIAYLPSGQTLASGSSDWTVRLWDLNVATPKQRFDPFGHLSHVYAGVFAPDGQTLASGSYDRTVHVWNVGQANPKVRTVLRGDWVPIYCLAYTPDGKTLAAGGQGTTIRLFDPLAGRELGRSLKGNPSYINTLCYAPDGRRLLAGSTYGKAAVLWDAVKAEELRRFETKTYMHMAALAPDARLAVVGSGEVKRDAEGKVVTDKAGNYVYIDCCMRLWDPDSGKELDVYKGHATPVGTVLFTPDGKQVLSHGSELEIRRHEVTEEKMKELPAAPKWPGGTVDVVAASPDGKLLATRGPSASVVLWEAETGEQVKGWNLNEVVGSLSFSSDSRYLAVTLAMGPVYVLRVAEPPGGK
jgi:WD40 repeat protein